MITSIYCGADSIEVATGEKQSGGVAVRSFTRVPLNEGTILNGVITSDTALVDALRSLAGSISLPRGGVDLVIDSASVLVKRAVVPLLPRKKLMALCKNEFIDLEDSYDDLVYDYSVVSPRNEDGDGGTILCCAVPRKFLDSYVDVFSEAGIPLRSIDLAIAGQIRLASLLPELAGQTYALAVLEGGTMVTSLFVKGRYVLTNRTRLLCERGEIKSTNEIIATVSSLMQWCKAQNFDVELSRVFFCDLNKDEEELPQAISESLHIAARTLPESTAVFTSCENYELSRALFATGNLLKKGVQR